MPWAWGGGGGGGLSSSIVTIGMAWAWAHGHLGGSGSIPPENFWKLILDSENVSETIWQLFGAN